MRQALFLSACRPEPGVFESQVLGFGNLLREIGLEFRYVVFEGCRAWLRSRRSTTKEVARLRRGFEVSIETHYVLSPLSGAGLAQAGCVLAKARAMVGENRLLIHARGPVAACAAHGAKKRLGSVAVLYDGRGDTSAEARMTARLSGTWIQKQRWERRASRLEVLERRACAGADHILAVSSQLAHKSRGLGNRSPDEVTVIPCCLDAGRFTRRVSTRHQIRQRLRLENHFVFVYSGSLAAWQVPGRTAALLAALQSCLPTVHLLLLTRDKTSALRFFGPLVEQGTCTIRGCSHDEVPDYLAAADAALLLREDDPVNHVASPVKFAEYLACGLPVIATPNIGDASEYLIETGHGFLIKLGQRPEIQALQITKAIASPRWPRDREAIRHRALQTFSRESYLDQYLRVLSRLQITTSCS